MCGICGYVQLDESKKVSEEVLKCMTAALVHRGPDDCGIFAKEDVGLGHRRLSIIDLETGHQPIFNADKSLAIVYNGEIYNFPELREGLMAKGYRFRTRSDTEVALLSYEEYGEECLKDFNGMFGLAIWDAKKRRLFLARDRFGKKPLYYGTFNNQFIFASELKSLLKHPDVAKEVDMDSVAKYLAYDYVPAPFTIFKNIHKLKAGHHLILEGGRIRIEEYWDFRFEYKGGFDPVEAKETLVSLFRDAVRRRLISDVPLGVFLSGGIDSSVIVAMMAELKSPKEIKTFSIGFKEESYDESSSAGLIARRFGTDHHQQLLKPDDMLAILPAVLENLDEPFADSSIIPTYLVSRFARGSVKVVLGGDGGDELFAGYPSFKAHRLAALYGALPAPFRSFASRALPALTPSSSGYVDLNFKMRRFLRGMDYPDPIRHQVWIGTFPPARQEALLASARSGPSLNPSSVYGTTIDYYNKIGSADILDNYMYVYMKTYMADDILAKVDKASMANSLEVRAPFLDARLAEFVATIPSSYKLKGFRTKWILREVFAGRLPGETLGKPKHGFAVPVGRWLRSELKGELLEALKGDKIKREGIFDPAGAESLLKDYLAGATHLDREIWSLFIFEMWYNKWAK